MVHRDGSKDSESSHNNKPERVAVFSFSRFEHSSGKGKGNRSSVVLEGVDYASCKSSHFLSPDIHRRGRANDGVGGVGSKGDEDKDGAPAEKSSRGRTDMTQEKNDSGS